MSWGVGVVGRPGDAMKEVQTQLGYAKKYSAPGSIEAVERAIGELLALFSGPVIVESSGHIDGGQGTGNITIRSIKIAEPLPGETERAG